MKICSKCKIEKKESQFYFRHGGVVLNSQCKDCHNSLYNSLKTDPKLRRTASSRRTPEEIHKDELIRHRQGKRCSYCKEIRPTEHFYVRGSGYFTSRCYNCDATLSVLAQRKTRYSGIGGLKKLEDRLVKLHHEIVELTALKERIY